MKKSDLVEGLVERQDDTKLNNVCKTYNFIRVLALPNSCIICRILYSNWYEFNRIEKIQDELQAVKHLTSYYAHNY